MKTMEYWNSPLNNTGSINQNVTILYLPVPLMLEYLPEKGTIFTKEACKIKQTSILYQYHVMLYKVCVFPMFGLGLIYFIYLLYIFIHFCLFQYFYIRIDFSPSRYTLFVFIFNKECLYNLCYFKVMFISLDNKCWY